MPHRHYKIQIPKFEPKWIMQSLSETYDWGSIDLKIPQVHKDIMGEGVTVAVIDSGEPDHFEVKNNILVSKNFSDARDARDWHGHSTFVSGIIAAEKNDEGIIGVAPKCKLVIAKALDDGGVCAPSSLVKAIYWCIEQKVDIISISAGMFMDFKPLHFAIQAAFQKNITVVAAAGNSGTRHGNIAFPARYPEVIAVAAYDKNRKTASFSSRGVNILVAMPGVDVYSCALNNQFCANSGTSFSAPFLTGICALILAKHKKVYDSSTPCNTPQQLMEHLKKYSVKLGAQNETGFGTLDVVNLLSNK